MPRARNIDALSRFSPDDSYYGLFDAIPLHFAACLQAHIFIDDDYIVIA